MDPIKKYFEEHKAETDHLEPAPEIWLNVSNSINQKDHRPHRTPLALLAGFAFLLLLATGSVFFNQPAYSSNGSNLSLSSLEVGNTFPEMSLRNPIGETVALSSLKGKVVLVEFWASYSKVCTEEHCYFFQPVYEQYKDRGFEIYGISVDSSATDWVREIERQELPWIQVADLAHAETPRLNSEHLPLTFLLDKNGTIVAKNLKAEELDQWLAINL